MENKRNVPAIRFKGFAEEWKYAMLEEVGCRYDNLRVPITEKDRIAGTTPYYGANGIQDYVEGFTHDGEYILIAEDGANDLDNYPVQYVNGRIWVNNHAHVFQGYYNIADNLFLQYSISQTNIKFLLVGGGRAKLNAQAMMNIKIHLTNNIKEQQKIGYFFKNIDDLIAKTEQQIDKLKNIKKACLDKMFPRNGSNTPDIRFKGFTEGWETKQFGTCVLIQRGGSPRPIDEFITNDENGINWIKIGDVSSSSRYITSTKEKIKPEGESKSRKVVRGDLILSNSMSFGRPYIMQIDGCIHDGWLLIRNDKGIFNLEYLLQMLSSDYMLAQYQSLASGGVVNNLNSELVQSTTVQITNKREQSRIGSFFQNMDDLIVKTEQKIEKLKNIKKACLDKMFVNRED